jgi:protein TonB
MTTHDFDTQLDRTLRSTANPTAPAGLEQRLLARLENASEASYLLHTLSSRPERSEVERPAAPRLPMSRETTLFTSAQRMVPQRSATSAWTALGLHAAAILLIAFAVVHHIQLASPTKTEVATLTVPTPPPPIAPNRNAIGGGGGHHDIAPATAGHLPKLAQTQIVPPKAPPTVAPKLAVEPAVVVQKDLKLADNTLPNLGMPNSTLHGVSLGNGSGFGIGEGNGSGIGKGTGGNMGGGIFHVGGSVKPPALLSKVDPEFSEEARKAKFSGNVVVSLIVDEQGAPTNVRCLRDIGMGLCGKAVEAVRQYRFQPATQNGKPVKVDVNIEVNFQIF